MKGMGEFSQGYFVVNQVIPGIEIDVVIKYEHISSNAMPYFLKMCEVVHISFPHSDSLLVFVASLVKAKDFLASLTQALFNSRDNLNSCYPVLKRAYFIKCTTITQNTFFIY
jgi:hypothetical protein